MITEIVDNSVDEHVAGFCDTISVIIEGDKYTVIDNGRGIPVTPHPKFPDKSQVEVAMGTLHGGGKFGSSEGYGSIKTGGMNGKLFMLF